MKREELEGKVIHTQDRAGTTTYCPYGLLLWCCGLNTLKVCQQNCFIFGFLCLVAGFWGVGEPWNVLHEGGWLLVFDKPSIKIRKLMVLVKKTRVAWVWLDLGKVNVRKSLSLRSQTHFPRILFPNLHTQIWGIYRPGFMSRHLKTDIIQTWPSCIV